VSAAGAYSINACLAAMPEKTADFARIKFPAFFERERRLNVRRIFFTTLCMDCPEITDAEGGGMGGDM
jgi:hypothetical protein